MSVSSVVPLAIEYLLTLLPSIPELDDTQITEGWAGNAAAREAIVIAGATSSQEWHTLGTRRKMEEATLDVYVMLNLLGGTATEVRTRAYELADIIDTLMRVPVHVTLGGMCASVRWVPVQWAPAFSDAGRAGVLHCELQIFGARI